MIWLGRKINFPIWVKQKVIKLKLSKECNKEVQLYYRKSLQMLRYKLVMQQNNKKNIHLSHKMMKNLKIWIFWNGLWMFTPRDLMNQLINFQTNNRNNLLCQN